MIISRFRFRLCKVSLLNRSHSIGDIAKAAGVGRVTVYGHFKNRADLVQC
jgi:AcrR family transcriptional regulator